MRANFISFILSSLLACNAFASECFLNEALKDPKLAENPQFWAEYGKLSAKTGKVSEEEMKQLVAKHGGNVSTATAASESANAFTPSLKISIQHKAEKEIKALQPALKVKVDEFLELASKPGGMQEIRNNPGRWHLEKLTELGGKAFTVRLNGGYRVLFSPSDDGLEVLRVNRDQIHNHLKSNH